MKRARKGKAREVILLLQDDAVMANFTTAKDYQIEKTIKHLREVYGRQPELVRFREVKPKQRRQSDEK